MYVQSLIQCSSLWQQLVHMDANTEFNSNMVRANHFLVRLSLGSLETSHCGQYNYHSTYWNRLNYLVKLIKFSFFLSYVVRFSLKVADMYHSVRHQMCLCSSESVRDSMFLTSAFLMSFWKEIIESYINVSYLSVLDVILERNY